MIAHQDIHGALGSLGYPRVKKGTRGIVRARPSGFFSNHYEVEFYRGGTVSVDARHLKPATFGGGGEEGWKKYQQRKQGVALGLFILFGLPAAIGLLKYYMAGGTTLGLIAAFPDVILGQIMDIVALVGLPLTLIAGAMLWLRGRHR